MTSRRREVAREKEVGDVGADDEEHDRDGAHDEDERLDEAAVIGGVEGLDGDVPAFVGGGKFLGEARGDGFHFGLRLVVRDAGFHAGEGFQIARTARAFAGFFGREGEGDEDIDGRVPGKLKFSGHDADDGVGMLVECDDFAENVGAAGEAALPEAEADDGDVIFTELRFFLGEETAEMGRDAEHGKEIVRDLEAQDALGSVLLKQVVRMEAVVGDVREDGVLLRDFLDVGERNARLDIAGALLNARLAEADEFFGARIGERADQYGVDEAEDGGVDADAERESEHGDQRERFVFAQNAQSNSKVLPEGAQHFFCNLPVTSLPGFAGMIPNATRTL